MVEEYIPGDYYRVFATKNKVVSVIKYDKVFITGDGFSTIQGIVDSENFSRRKKYANKIEENVLSNIDIALAKLKKLNLSKDSVLQEGQTILVSDFPTRRFGSIGKEIINLIDVNEFSIAVDAVNSIPGLNSNSLDVVVHEVTGVKYVLELNGTPHLRGNLWPLEGVRQPVIEEFVRVSLGVDRF
jgi:D-alanine-D-alanine ligase-like ATP-grasp enzyme